MASTKGTMQAWLKRSNLSFDDKLRTTEDLVKLMMIQNFIKFTSNYIKIDMMRWAYLLITPNLSPIELV